MAADAAATVIVGAHAVTRYANRTGALSLWSLPTGSGGAGLAGGRQLPVRHGRRRGYLGAAPVTALRRINLRTGAERLIQATAPCLRRARSASPSTGWSCSRAPAVSLPTARPPAPACGTGGPGSPESVDVRQRRLYLLVGNALVGVDPATGPGWPRSPAPTAESAGLYGVQAGAVLGLDRGALGKAWGYDVATQRVLWTSAPAAMAALLRRPIRDRREHVAKRGRVCCWPSARSSARHLRRAWRSRCLSRMTAANR